MFKQYGKKDFLNLIVLTFAHYYTD